MNRLLNVPCRHCFELESDHPKKCLFGPMKYRPLRIQHQQRIINAYLVSLYGPSVAGGILDAKVTLAYRSDNTWVGEVRRDRAFFRTGNFSRRVLLSSIGVTP